MSMKLFTVHHICSRQALSTLALIIMVFWVTLSRAESVSEASAVDGQEQPVALSVEQLKRKVIELSRDLFILEEDLLFPASTQFAVYLSLDTGQFMQLDSAKLKVDDQIVAAHLYTERQIKALQRGGLQRLHIGNLPTGSHEITVLVEGLGPEQQPYKQAATLTLEKGTQTQALEVRIRDQSASFQPTVELVEWP